MTTELVNNDFQDIVFGRDARRSLDPNVKISREEILEIFRIATRAPSAIDSQPWHFLVVDTDEGKQKLDGIMHPPYDNGRVIASSFSVVVFADRQWAEDYEEVVEANIEFQPALYSPLMASQLRQASVTWVDELIEKGELDHSVCFQAGLVSMLLMLAVRSHGYESGPMDSWDKERLDELFGIDLERYIPLIVIPVGVPTAPGQPVTRRDPKDVVEFA